MINPLLIFQSALYFSRKCPLFALYFDRKMPSICPLFGCPGPLNIIGQYAIRSAVYFYKLFRQNSGAAIVGTVEAGAPAVVLAAPQVPPAVFIGVAIAIVQATGGARGAALVFAGAPGGGGRRDGPEGRGQHEAAVVGGVVAVAQAVVLAAGQARGAVGVEVAVALAQAAGVGSGAAAVLAGARASAIGRDQAKPRVEGEEGVVVVVGVVVVGGIRGVGEARVGRRGVGKRGVGTRNEGPG